MTRAQDVMDIATEPAADGDPHNPKAVTTTVKEANGSNEAHEKVKNWIPIAEHVLWEPQRKVKVISIGCGFSGKDIITVGPMHTTLSPQSR